jgi:uncharacterized membrane protein (UPF0127 family)
MTTTRQLRIENVTRQTTLVERGQVADTYWRRLKGLMGVRHLVLGEGLLIRPANQVHTHFMAIPVDVVYLDDQNRIIDIDHDLRPWRIGRLRRAAHSVVEAPSGTAAATGCAAGDLLRITPH